MIQRASLDLSHLYEADETAWLDAMSERIREGRIDDLDYLHLGEYLADMANRDRKEVKSRLITLLLHLLKWEFQPDKRTTSRQLTIQNQQDELADDATTGVLRNHAEEILAEAYRRAVRNAAGETALPSDAFPAECPYTVEQLLTTEFTVVS